MNKIILFQLSDVVREGLSRLLEPELPKAWEITATDLPDDVGKCFGESVGEDRRILIVPWKPGYLDVGGYHDRDFVTRFALGLGIPVMVITHYAQGNYNAEFRRWLKDITRPRVNIRELDLSIKAEDLIWNVMEMIEDVTTRENEIKSRRGPER